ncbi:MAG: hypothetical protein GY757_16460 [bacterium]|nr:hypothetical protein [bacterium]
MADSKNEWDFPPFVYDGGPYPGAFRPHVKGEGAPFFGPVPGYPPIPGSPPVPGGGINIFINGYPGYPTSTPSPQQQWSMPSPPPGSQGVIDHTLTYMTNYLAYLQKLRESVAAQLKQIEEMEMKISREMADIEKTRSKAKE